MCLARSPEGETWNDTFGAVTPGLNHGKLKIRHGNLASVWNALLMEEHLVSVLNVLLMEELFLE